MIKSFRLRLTVWYLVLFSLLFLVFGAFLYTLLSRALQNRLDEALSEEVNTTASLFQSELEELHGDARGPPPRPFRKCGCATSCSRSSRGRACWRASAPPKGRRAFGSRGAGRGRHAAGVARCRCRTPAPTGPARRPTGWRSRAAPTS